MNHSLIVRLRDFLWSPEILVRTPRVVVRLARYLFVLVRDLLEGQLSMRAMSLVYTTLLSLVPMLALAFSVLKALGVHNSLEPVLLELLRPLGEQSAQITQSVIGFVENIQVGVLGSLGVALLFYAAVSMIQKVEASFNYIWRIEQARPLSQRLGEYLAVLTVGPVLVFSALGVTATLLSSEMMTRLAAVEPLGFALYAFTRMLPFLLVILAFTFVYSFMPNTRVRLRPALMGGILAGLLWQSASLAFASFVAGATNYNAIYSGFAIIIFLLIWLYLGWLILLLGCQLAFYVQHPEQLKPQRIPPTLFARQTEYLGLAMMTLVARRFIRGEPPYSEEALSLALNAAPEHVARVAGLLRYHGLLVPAGPGQDLLVPGMDLDSIPLSRLWRVIRAGTGPIPRAEDPAAAEVLGLLDATEREFEAQHRGRSLKDFAASQPG
jgi:membrane protein